MILGRASKVELIRFFSSLTVEEVVQNDYPSVGLLKKEHGLQKVEKAMSVLLYDLSSSFDGSLKKEDVQEIAAEVSSSTLANLSLEDIYLSCREIKTSEHYGKLNVNKVLKTMHKHLAARTDVAAKISYNHHLANKVVDNHTPTMNDMEVQKANFRAANIWHLKEQAKK